MIYGITRLNKNNTLCLKYGQKDCLEQSECNWCNKMGTCLNLNAYKKGMCTTDSFKENKKESYKRYKVKNMPLRTRCNELCNNDAFCQRFETELTHFDNCTKCNGDSKCYSILDTDTGVCANCSKYQINLRCNNVRYLGCPRIDDIYNFSGIRPYFLLINSEGDVTNPYNTKCVRCK